MEQGLTNLQVLHTYDRQEAETAEFVKPLTEAKCVIFEGGETYRLFETYVGTRFHRAVQEVLARGGVVAGYSAGAMVMGSIVIDRPYMRFRGYKPGFGLLPDSMIDVHVLARNMHLDLVAARQQHPTTLGLGIDERAAIVVQQDWMYPIGQSYTVIYDYEVNGVNDGLFYFLKAGDSYNLKQRRAERKSWSTKPFERFYQAGYNSMSA